MAKARPFVQALNVGVVDKPTLARVDLERMRLAAEQQTNLLPTTTGKAFLRPGLEYIGSSNVGRLKSFVRGPGSASMLELTVGEMRVWVDDELVTRPSVTSTVTSGTFASSTGWTLSSDDGQTSSISGGFLTLRAQAVGALALAKQQVSTSSPNVQHALRIVINRGPVTFRCGSSEGGDEYIKETLLFAGTHSLAFTPAGSYWVQFQNDTDVDRIVDSIQVEGAGVMTLATPWADFGLLRFAQSIDVMFVSCRGVQQHRIERRSDASWSLVKYFADDGPFTITRTAPVRLKPNVTHGNGTLTADKPFFRSEHAGCLFRLFHEGQVVLQQLADDEAYSDPVEITGINTASYSDREFAYTVSGTYSGTLTIFRSFDDPEFGYREYLEYAADATINDEDDNAVIWYRIGFGEGDYTSGVATIGLSYAGGGGYGICRVTAFISPTQVAIEILRPFRNTKYTDDWREGEWSELNGWPTAVALTEGRLWWGGSDRFWGSVSDAYSSFDEDTEGDSGPILRNIAVDGVNNVQTLLPLHRLIALTDGAEAVVRSSSFDEPLTPTNATVKTVSTFGAAAVDSIKVDARGLFVEKSDAALMELVFSAQAGDFQTTEISKLAASLFSPGIKEIAVQRRPDTRLWVICNDGSMVSILYEPDQEVLAFIPVETDGSFESATVLPSSDQDRVYFLVRRTINGSVVRYIEKLARDSDVAPGLQPYCMDACAVGSQLASTTISGATHLIGEQVKVWADGAPLNEEVTVNGYTYQRPRLFTVNSSGEITGLPVEVVNYAYGLPYKARYKSARLAYGAAGGTAMLQKKKVDDIGFVMADYVRSGITFGRAFDDDRHPLYPLPAMQDGMTVDDVQNGVVRDEHMVPFEGSWDTDSRICAEIQWPAAILGLVYTVTTHE